MKQFLQDIVTEAGNLSLEYRAKLSELQVQRKSPKDLVTEADKAVEAFLCRRITERYPDHAIFGEETGHKAGNEFRWVIDPIDGTTSFVHKQPFYAISVAVEKAGHAILAAVNAPVLHELFLAEKDAGATLNGKPIHVSQCELLEDAVLATGFACVRVDLPKNNLPYFTALVPKIRDVRRYGSAAIDLSYVACGRLDGFWELNLQTYDIAAGLLLVTEAGGMISDFSHRQTNMPYELVATNTLLHKELIQQLQAVST